MERSKNQKTAARVLLGGGVALSVIGIIGVNAYFNLSADSGPGDTYAVVWLIGSGLALASIPLFSASGRNARKAAKLSFKAQPFFTPAK